MHDLEFLPAWYPQLRQRRRMVRLQAYMTLLLATGLCVWIFLVHRNLRTASATLADTNNQLLQTHRELSELQQQVDLKNQLLLQRRIVDRLGLPVDMSRMLATLDDKMPRGMSLTDCTFQTQQQLKVMNSAAAMKSVSRGEAVDRRLDVRVQGVAPTDNDVANFLAQLTNLPFFDQVAMTYSRDREQDGRIMREFEITFSIDLEQQVDDGAAVAETGGGS